MINKFKILPHQRIEAGAKINAHLSSRPGDISLQDPALKVMTDLNEIKPFSIEPTANLDAIYEKMVTCGVRLLFVTDSEDKLLGLVTQTDLMGEKPVKFITEHRVNRSEVTAQDIMTAKDKLDVLNRADVEKASVGDIVETMKELGRQHTLVMHKTDTGEAIICGIFSNSQIIRQTGVTITPSMRANTLADMREAMLST